MRVFYLPLPPLFTAIATAAQVVGTITSARAGSAQAKAQAGQADAQAGQEAIDRRRALADIDAETDAYGARARALYAAGGGDTASGSALAVLEGGAAEGALRRTRTEADSIARESSLRTLATNIRSVAKTAKSAAWWTALGQLTGGASKVYDQWPQTVLKPAPTAISWTNTARGFGGPR